MKTIGLIGGLSWESSAEYYRIINEEVRRRLGRSHSARSLMLSLDFAEIEALQHQGHWQALEAKMVSAAQDLVRGGAEMVLICSNTMHRAAEAVESALSVPFLHIADPTGALIAKSACSRVGLLGTAFTMQGAFYRDRLAQRFGLDVMVPDPASQVRVHEIIYQELVLGHVSPASREEYRAIISRLADEGAQAVILGCTEIMLLVSAEDSPVPLFDTTELHAKAAVDMALS